ncbi:ABC transporter [Novosphingobium sp. PASSN1]|uniref:ABC transporter n=1 Tax=Novosphingobium sp. PASSN1 TaxID=2015561 RepID=UPI000BCB9520|nr:ABC transporter [Novosphingobium sp. PASSN1]OYU36161.1 MAG: ABC transporter [Novosphingobium sp. PASSN1]
MSARLAVPGKPHWARPVLEESRRLVPLDTLLAPGALADLLIAQPRPLEPAENVALDGWVRSGGHLLLFADPLLTSESRFPLGDPRRPADTVLLSPILTHWGLALREDRGERENAGMPFPVNAPGELSQLPGAVALCRIEEGGLMAQCRIGKGSALIVADAALLEPAEGPAAAQRGRMLRMLMRRAFAP